VLIFFSNGNMNSTSERNSGRARVRRLQLQLVIIANFFFFLKKMNSLVAVKLVFLPPTVCSVSMHKFISTICRYTQYLWSGYKYHAS